MALARTTTLTVRIDALELARGHDGLLRGQPEPVVLMGVFTYGDRGPVLRGRHIVRLPTPDKIPATLSPRQSTRISATMEDGDEGFVIVGFALEEDNGADIARVFGALERPERIVGWRDGEELPHPRPLHHVAIAAPRTAAPVHVVIDGENLERIRGDGWVGGSVIGVPADTRYVSDARMSFLSPDRKNDWTARVHVTLRSLS